MFHGADPSLTTGRGQSPLEIAQDNKLSICAVAIKKELGMYIFFFKTIIKYICVCFIYFFLLQLNTKYK